MDKEKLYEIGIDKVILLLIDRIEKLEEQIKNRKKVFPGDD